jgi:hypothetical protein
MIDPTFLMSMMGKMQGTQALQPGFDASGGGGEGGPDFMQMLGGLKQQTPQNSPLSGGVSGVGAQPFLQSFQGDILQNALTQGFSRMGAAENMTPTLGALLAGAR